ncbi:hypothetical protein DWB58_17675, partial [candidate division KSB1 bacterium]|nr:hypothetical protein [candidate division KSB1 bacterium]
MERLLPPPADHNYSPSSDNPPSRWAQWREHLQHPDQRWKWYIFLGVLIYLILISQLIRVRPDHLFFALVVFAFVLGKERAKRFLIDWLPFILFWVAYDMMRGIADTVRGTIHVVEPYRLEHWFFGWLPALIWIILGSIFVGGVHDFGSLVASVRHKAKSIAELARQYMSPLSYKLFLAFIWLTLVYVIVVFLDLTAVSFIDTPGSTGAAEVQGTGVAVASGIFMVLAIGLGVTLHQTKVPLWMATTGFVGVLLAAAVWSSGITSDGAYLPKFLGDARET